MTDSKLMITSGTKVAELLHQYPQLEDVLIGIAPPFKKLRNRVLRKSVAKVASLRQAAAVGRMPVDELVDRLRAAVGQEPLTKSSVDDSVDYFAEQPEWFDRARVSRSINEENDLDPDQMPLVPVAQAASRLEEGEILELITSHLPAPGIDIMKKKGFLVWSEQEGPVVVRTYFLKPLGRR